MKLVFRGHDERYVVEQSLMNLFPGELPVYEPITPGDDSWAVISLEETGTSAGWRSPSAGAARPPSRPIRSPSPAAISSGRASAATPSAPASSWRPGRSPA